jgi:hypothetical protein
MKNPAHPDIHICFCAYGFRGRSCEIPSTFAPNSTGSEFVCLQVCLVKSVDFIDDTSPCQEIHHFLFNHSYRINQTATAVTAAT